VKARHADRVYRSGYDTIRVRVFRHESGEGWDFDVFRKDEPGHYCHTYTSACAESPMRTLREVQRWCREHWGSVVEINPATVTEGW